MDRREMMAGCLAVLWTRHIVLRASELEFAPLRTPVELTKDSLLEPWRPVLFKAWASRADGTDLLLQGLAVRISDNGGVKAFCLYCPHEQCILRLTSDTQKLFCGCHLSTFDPQLDGELVADSGPAPRGAYRFKLDESSSNIVISGIEADALRV